MENDTEIRQRILAECLKTMPRREAEVLTDYLALVHRGDDPESIPILMSGQPPELRKATTRGVGTTND